MNKFIIVLLLLCNSNHLFSQNDLIDRISKQAIEIDSLRKVITFDLNKLQQLNNERGVFEDSIKRLNIAIGGLVTINTQNKTMDSVLRLKCDSILLLKFLYLEKDKLASIELKEALKKAEIECEKGKSEIMNAIFKFYKNHTFDEVLESSQSAIIMSELTPYLDNQEVKVLINDLDIYFAARKSLEVKMDPILLKNHQIQLGRLKRDSKLLNSLKENIWNYETFNNGFKETLQKIIQLDITNTVSALPKEVQKKKFDLILGEISGFIYSYNFQLSDYPYLSVIFFELIRRKQTNPDADISDLLKKL